MSTSSGSSPAALLSPLPHTGPGPLCDECQHLPLDSYSTSSCPYNVCPECRELEALDTQIAEIHSLLVNLATKRYNIKRKINRRHDELTARLPVEVISRIFTIIASESCDNERDPPLELLLGAVCTRWRDITLGTSGLWKTLTVNPRNDVSLPDMLAQWLSRSRSAPLTLNIHATMSDQRKLTRPSLFAQYSNILQSLRSHAGHWKDLTLKVLTEMLDGLLAGLGDRVLLDSLSIETPDGTEHGDKMTMEYLLVPKRVFIQASQIRLQWDRLTHMEVDRMGVDSLIHIFGHAHNLQSCFLTTVVDDTGYYPIPNSPVTNSSIEFFDVKDFEEIQNGSLVLLSQLTLPSLKTLHSEIWYDHPEKIHALSGFLDRSQPPLCTFSLFHSNGDNVDHDFYPIFSSLTSLELEVYEDDQGRTIQGYLKRLGAHIEPIALPCLRSLEISGRFMNPRSWDALAAIFPDSETLPQRPLKTVKIYLNSQSNKKNMHMRKATYTRLRAIQKSGISIKVVTKHGNDILGCNVSLQRRSENGMVTLKFSDIDEGESDDDFTYGDSENDTEEQSDEDGDSSGSQSE